MKVTEKRNPRTYKCTDKEYKAAIKRAKKLKFPLSNLLEMVVQGFGQGLDLRFVSYKDNTGTSTSFLDHFSDNKS